MLLYRPSKSDRPPSSEQRVRLKPLTPSPRPWTRPERVSLLSEGLKLARTLVSAGGGFPKPHRRTNRYSLCSHFFVWIQERHVLACYQLGFVDADPHIDWESNFDLQKRCKTRQEPVIAKKMRIKSLLNVGLSRLGSRSGLTKPASCRSWTQKRRSPAHRSQFFRTFRFDKES